MSLSSRLGLALAAITLPILALAAAPSGVTGIRATAENGRVQVQWNQIPGDVSAYRIYYSHTSILQNNGQYDDFDSVDASVNSHLLQNIPPTNELFISVLAVNSTGDESPYFMEEAHVVLSGTAQPTPASSSASLPSAPVATDLRLLEVISISATGVTLRFSHPIAIPLDKMGDAVRIEAGSGMYLAITLMTVQDSVLTIHTLPQERGKTYSVRINSVITGKMPDGRSIPLAGDQTPMLFAGHLMGTEPTAPTPSQPQPQPTERADITNLRLRAEAQLNGLYTVEGTWTAPSVPGIAMYLVSQTTDGGRTYGQAMQVAPTALGARIAHVQPGTFGIFVKTTYTNGSVSNGILQTISLPALAAQTPTTGNVTQPSNPGGSAPLPNSGPALWLAILAAGAGAGYFVMHRRRVKSA